MENLRGIIGGGERARKVLYLLFAAVLAGEKETEGFIPPIRGINGGGKGHGRLRFYTSYSSNKFDIGGWRPLEKGILIS